jgi:hypothetical protein
MVRRRDDRETPPPDDADTLCYSGWSNTALSCSLTEHDRTELCVKSKSDVCPGGVTNGRMIRAELPPPVKCAKV